MSRRINLIFPDGTLATGATFREVEDALRAAQWSTYRTRREFRKEMRRRAEMWSGRSGKPVLTQTSKQFIYHLVHAEVCVIEITNYPEQEQS